MTLDGELWAVRHGRSAANEAFERARVDGRVDAGIEGRDADVALSSAGRVEAAALGRWFDTLPEQGWPDVVCVSPYRRARQTLDELVAQVRQQPRSRDWAPVVRVDERLRDRETGVLELMTPAAVEAKHPTEVARRRRVGEVYYRPPGGESLLDVGLRLCSFLQDLERSTARRVLVVGHDATVLMLRAVIEELDEAAVADVAVREPVANASVSHWQRTPQEGWILRDYNATGHLDDLDKIGARRPRLHATTPRPGFALRQARRPRAANRKGQTHCPETQRHFRLTSQSGEASRRSCR